MKDEPLVSVCITAYNREEYTQIAIKSVLNQTYQNFEIIVIDDGSTDDTVLKIESFKDSRIKLFKNKKNRGVIYSRNHYLKKAKGAYIAVLDSDDIWLPEKLSLQIDFFQNNPEYVMCGTHAEIFYANGETKKWIYPVTDEEIRIRLLWGSAIVHSSLVLKRDVLTDTDILYDESLTSAEDYNFIRELVRCGKVYNMDRILVKYRLHGDQLTLNENYLQKKCAFDISNMYLQDIGISLTTLQVELFRKLFNFEYCFSLEDLKDISFMFLQILLKTSSSKKLEQQYLRQDLSKKWFLVCYNSSHNGISVLNLYFRNKELFEKPMLSFRNLKFFIKCLLWKK